ncbi:uncharacterized protein [Blastocystis hominis]|uniref:DNA mismatch repair protein n=1 Tax=Blastocystis hominis TaxID=12968 RepID=D8M8Y2_BLAHO|nr:uncharacterized protein [Blastocystis hominis]CBK24521.2 unnamed protein product [Blastocystis hominis]|eukprot:XP_012898569.1 uncharacterized protein [Blastocystis hominis]
MVYWHYTISAAREARSSVYLLCSLLCSYDDGEVEWIDSTKEQYEIVESEAKGSDVANKKMEQEPEPEPETEPELKMEIETENKAESKQEIPTQHSPEQPHSAPEQPIIKNSPKPVKSSRKSQTSKSTDSDDAYQPNSNDDKDDDDDDEDDDIPIAKLRRFIVSDSDSDSDSDAPILSKKTPSKPAITPSVPRTPTKRPAPSISAYSSSPVSTPSKLPRPSSTPKSTPKRQRTSEAGLDDEKLSEKKGAVILNAGEHAHDNTEWMIHPRDKYKHSPSDPKYDPTSLFVPSDYLRGCTNGMKQWWAVKQQAFDCVLLMKVGKFYETYHMDADIVVKVCDLVYMKGETAHAGFPEAAYSKFSNQLVNANYRVARVEQTETPQQMKERNAVSEKKALVRREVCSIITPGVAGHGTVDKIYNQKDHRILCSIVEERKDESPEEEDLGKDEEKGKKMVQGGKNAAVVIGLCIVDTVFGDFYLGQFIDDDQRTALRTQLLRFLPTEFILHKNALHSRTIQLLRRECPSAMLSFVDPQSSFEPQHLLRLVKQNNLFDTDDDSMPKGEWPDLLEMIVKDREHPEPAFSQVLSALYLSSAYLHRCCVARLLMSQHKFYLIDNIDRERDQLVPFISNQLEEVPTQSNMILDAITLRNLDILPDPSNPSTNSLFQYIDHTVTPFGKRLLKEWLCKPLYQIDAINKRLDAVEELISKTHISQLITTSFKGIVDVDRLLSRLHDYCQSVILKAHPDNRAQYYEDKKYNTRKIKDFVQLIEVMKQILKTFKSVSESFSSEILRSLFTISSLDSSSSATNKLEFPDMTSVLDFFDHSFNHEVAIEQGIIMPKPGMDPELDKISMDLQSTQRNLENYLEEIRNRFHCQKIEYFGSNKDRFQLQFPESVCQSLGAMPKEFLLKSRKKGFKRFWTPYIQEQFARLQVLEDKKQTALKNCTATVFTKFYQHYDHWKQMVNCVATLDVLQSLAVASSVGDNRGDCARPLFVERGRGASAVLELQNSRHPCVINTFSHGDFIANDISLGGSAASCKIITGPNMGGKSTLLRQVAVSIILAQIGCFVPASYMRLSPVDRIFTRIGAQDRILSNQSTFYVELIETSLILSNCTEDSFLIIDELGRGTSTYDGSAIVYAVLKYLSHIKKCRLLFSTHYNFIITSFVNDPSISTGYMSYLLEQVNGQDRVTFLYKLVEGVCPESFGLNVARLSMIPESVLSRAKEVADMFNINLNLDSVTVKYFMMKHLQTKLKDENIREEDLHDFLTFVS